MGGSAIGGDLVKLLAKNELKIPFVISRNYKLPNWVNQNTLVICSSYSGNTEETLSCFDDSLNKSAKIVGISTGGKLTELLIKNKLDVITIPSGLQPRAALALSFVPMLYLLNKIGFRNIDKNHLNSSGITHGGYVASIIDAGAGTGAHRAAGNVPCVTISLDIKFIGSTVLGDEIIGFTKIQKITNSMVFLICHLECCLLYTSPSPRD